MVQALYKLTIIYLSNTLYFQLGTLLCSLLFIYYMNLKNNYYRKKKIESWDITLNPCNNVD